MRTDVIIVGSGIIGMSLALSLSMKKKKVIIVEKNFFNNLRVNRIYAISEKTKIFFENIDIWENTENINTLSGMNLFYRKFNQESLVSLEKKDSCSNIGYIVPK
jgi:2-polyprenyl-6-methoxyphenol hydroxylase-like FAD-dependent oxidoreductase